jgi:signal transduction histidine kinase
LNESLFRIFFTYLAHIGLAVMLFLVFIHFSKVFGKHYLRLWAFSWLAMAVHTLGPALQFWVSRAHEFGGLMYQGLSIFSLGALLWHLALLLFGTYELVKGIRTKIAHRRLVLLLTLVLAFVLYLAYSTGQEYSNMRYFLRVGVRYFLAMVTFLACGWAILRFERDLKGIGRKLLAWTLMTWSLVLGLYFTTVLVNVLGGSFPFPFAYFGIFDLMFEGLIGMAMVLWLLEGEHQKLKKANEELDSFLYRTSHDLRSPIASVLGLTHLMRLESQDPKALEYNQKIEDRVLKLDAVIGDILKYTRSNKATLRRELVDFNEIVEESFSNVAYHEGGNRITLIYHPDPRNVFISDAYQLKLILSNLISNAVKYHRLDQESPYVKVGFTKNGPQVRMVVEDNGQGIGPEHQEKIFDMFYRASESSEGSGLGLFIVKEAILRLKGHLRLETEMGKGSRFVVELNEGAL